MKKFIWGEITWAEFFDCYQEYSSTFSISGPVSGDVQVGVTMALSGNAIKSMQTDASGNYNFN